MSRGRRKEIISVQGNSSSTSRRAKEAPRIVPIFRPPVAIQVRASNLLKHGTARRVGTIAPQARDRLGQPHLRRSAQGLSIVFLGIHTLGRSVAEISGPAVADEGDALPASGAA